MRPFSSTIALRSHLSQDALTRMACREQRATRGLLAKVHLRRCSRCRVRYQAIKSVTRAIVEFREQTISRLESPSTATRERFIRRLELQLELESSPAKAPRKPSVQGRFRSFWGSGPALGSALVTLSAIVLFCIARLPLRAVSASEALDRAVASDYSAAKISGSGLICRKLRIRTAHKLVERSLYLDASGRRQPKFAKTTSDEKDLAARLALAGVNWDDPLSAVSFKAWHDRQTDARDAVRQDSNGFLTISTRLSSSDIAAESLTVSEESFHPVERIIEYRHFGIVSISEVSVDILSSATANQLFLEPRGNNHTLANTTHPAIPLLPNAIQKNDAEIQARLILNQKNADTGEQVEITRDAHGVQVRGVVESDERKTELNTSLAGIPFVAAEIRSFDDLKSAGDSQAPTTSVLRHTMVARVSPLEQYLVAHGRGRDDLSRISAGLFNTSLAINRSCRSLQQTALRFRNDEDLSPSAIAARDELLQRIIKRLLHDLDLQQQFLDEAQIGQESGTAVSGITHASQAELVQLAERNMAATRELISGDGESTNPEKPTAAELADAISRLHAAALASLQGRSEEP